MPDQQLSALVQLAMQGSFSIVFLWLYMAERKAHEETRRVLYDTLREVAGMRVSLQLAQHPADTAPTDPTRRNWKELAERRAAARKEAE